MSAVVTCPSCTKGNRVPLTATGTPACGPCGATLPWIVEADEQTFDEAVTATVPVLVDLWAPWCVPCRMVSPVLERLATERAGRLKVVKVNVDTSPTVAGRYAVQGIPTLLLLAEGEFVARQVGAAPADALSKWIDANTSASMNHNSSGEGR